MKSTLTHIALVVSKSTVPIHTAGADHLYFRADLAEDVWQTAADLLSLGLPVVFSLRSTVEGGKFQGTAAERKALLIRAAETFAYLELECERDLIPEILEAVPAHKRIVSWHGDALPYPALKEIYGRCQSVAAAYYLVVPSAKKVGEELAAVKLMRESRGDRLICFASGETGQWTRILAPFLGSPMVLAGREPGHDEAPGIIEWSRDYGLPATRRIEMLFGITGNPVRSSLSPRLHNRAYAHHGQPYLFLPLHVDSFADFWGMITGDEWKDSVGIPIGGLTTVSPYKEKAFAAMDLTDNSLVRITGASNLALNREGSWWADTTDGHGVATILAQMPFFPRGRPVAVIGCGGAGRAIAIRLKNMGAAVTLFNRSAQRGRIASEMLNVPFRLASDFDPGEFDLVIHATPQGKRSGELPFDPDSARPGTVIIDLTYSNAATALIAKAQEKGLRTGSGKEVLVHQVRQQYFQMTGRQMPMELAMECAGLERLDIFKTENYGDTSTYQVG